MEETINLKSIVLSRQDFKESDNLVNFYTKEKGKILLVARGVKKINSKIAGHIEPLSLVDLMLVKGRQYDYVGSIRSTDSFLNIKSDLNKLETALKIVVFFKKNIKENDSDKDLYELLLESLVFLNKEKENNLDFFYNVFILKALFVMGYQLNIKTCLKCNRMIAQENSYLSVPLGGILCLKCGSGKENLTISLDCIKMLKLAINNDFENISRIKINQKLIKSFVDIVSSFKNYSLS